MENIIVLKIPFQFGDLEDAIYPVVLQDNAHTVLVDCGYIGFLPALEKALGEHELSFNTFTHVLITHHDHDHMGALFALKSKYPHIQVIASELEAPYIAGIHKSLRLEQAETMQPYLPEEQQAFGLAFCNLLKSVQPAAVDICVRGGDILDWCGGCTVLHTPGHTPGHISLFLNRKHTIIAGDAAAFENGRLAIANPQFTLDMPKAEDSLNSLKQLGAQEIICYHGGVCKL